jgi:hypothetical protein
MTSLFIAGWAKANSASSAGLHAIGVFLVSLDIASEFKANMLAIVQMFAGKGIARQKVVGDTIGMWEGVKPKDSIAHEPNEHKPCDMLEGERVIPTADSILHSADKPFNLWDMFVLCTQIEWNIREEFL